MRDCVDAHLRGGGSVMAHFVRYLNANRQKKAEVTEGDILEDIENRCLHLECLAAVVSMAADDQSSVTDVVKNRALFLVEEMLQEHAAKIQDLVFALAHMKEGENDGRDGIANGRANGSGQESHQASQV
jgi:hypothetical protein